MGGPVAVLRLSKGTSMQIVLGPVLVRKGGYSFDCWTPEEGSAAATLTVASRTPARNVEIRSRNKGSSRGSTRSASSSPAKLGEPEATEGVPARYSKGVRVRKIGLSEDAHHANKCSCSSAIRWASAYYGRKASRRQAQLSEPQRSGPCRGKRQDAARNCRCV